MNRVRNHAVIQNWREGVSARNHQNTLQSVACEGGVTELYSYEQKIGHRTANGVCVVADFTAPGGQFHSMTTSCHVNGAKVGASLVMHPRVWAASAFRNSEVPF